MSELNTVPPEEWDRVSKRDWDNFKAKEAVSRLSDQNQIPDYLTKEQLAQALKDALEREAELKGKVYELEETITGLTSR